MGIEAVNNQLRYLDIAEGWGVDSLDVATAKMHHEYNPSRNHCLCEFKIPSLSKQMPEDYFEEVADTKHYPMLHRMKYNKVENLDFHSYLRVEGRDNIDKVRRVDGNHVITYYFSNTRRLGLLKHDYYLAALVFLNYPIRDFIRRTPCKKLDPRCMPGCADNLRLPIPNWLNDPEPFTTRLDKFFFSYIGEKHRVCLAYTVEDMKSHDKCFEIKEPDYYIMDMKTKYFKEAFWDMRAWENSIMEDRRNTDSVMYHLEEGYTGINYGGNPNPPTSVSFRGYGGTASCHTYSMQDIDGVPAEIGSALDNNDFAGLWKADLASFNTRNSIHKWTFNHWQDICNNADDGWWCAWDTSEVIAGGATTAEGFAAGAGEAVGAQLTQVAGMFGWAPTGDTTGTDTVYILVDGMIPGYVYEPFLEPLPERFSSLF